MAVRTAYAPVAGSVLTAANLAKVAGGWIGDASVTANQTGITVATDLTNLTLTVTVGTGRRIKVSAMTNLISTVANDVALLTIQEGATVLQTISGPVQAAAGLTFDGWVTLTPTSGAHTYKLTLARAAGTGNLSLNASATVVAQILVEDIGATP